jgi:hypothetical protein
MANIYGAYLINVTDNGGQSSHQKFNMERIEDHSILKLYVAKSPEKIWFEVLEPSSSDEPYEGLLVNAPKDKSYFVELKDLDQEAVRKLGALAPQHIAEFGPPMRTWNTMVYWWKGSNQWKVG